MAERQEASPDGTLSSEHSTQKDTAGGRFVHQLQLLLRKAEQDPRYRSRGEVLSPASIIHYELLSEVQRDQPADQQKADFFQTISDAWGIIAFDRFSTREIKQTSVDTLYYKHKRAVRNNEPNPAIITLSPQQTTIIDTLADAARIPDHQKGQ